MKKSRGLMKKSNGMALFLAILLLLLFPILSQAHNEASKSIPLGINSLEKIKPNGSFSVYIFRDTEWQKVTDLTFDRFFRERIIDLDSYISSAKTVRIKLLQRGGGAAHIDSILLGGIRPIAIKESQNSIDLKKLAQTDNDVIDAYGKATEVIFSSERKNNTLTLVARVESEKISEVPFQFPLRNLFRDMNEFSEFYTYPISSRDESSGPFFREYSRTGSGHPSGFTYGWVTNDDKNLYVRIDFTPDNTMDGDKDYAKVYVKTEKGLREFKVSVPEKKWGSSDFTYTDKVTYQHKIYDFKIPFSELGIEDAKPGENLLLAFAAYGTSFPGDYSSDIAFDPTTNRYLAVIQRVGTGEVDIFGQILNCDGSPFGNEFLIFDSDSWIDHPKISYDSDNHRFLVVWSYANDAILGQLVNPDGTPFEDTIKISDADDLQLEPHVSYDNVSGRYLVVWQDRRNSSTTATDIYGQFVDANGSPIGDNFPICENEYWQQDPSVIFDSKNERFLVSWVDDRNDLNNRDIYGQILNTKGLPEGSEFVISKAVNHQWDPQLSNDSINHRFLVVWQDYRNDIADADVYGQLVEADGSLTGDNFLISTAINNQYFPEAVFDKANNRFLVIWQDNRNDLSAPDIYGQFIDSNGSLNGNDFIVAYDPKVGYELPRIASNCTFHNFLVFYTAHEGSIYDWALTRIGPPCCLHGDINMDDSIDISDVILVLRMALGLDPQKVCPCPICQ